jgi:paraquat-inducible protein B
MKKTRFPLYFPCLLLAACAAQPPSAPAPAPPVRCTPVIVKSPAPPNVTDELLAYHRSLRQLSPADLLKEFANLNLKPTTARLMLQRAMALTLMHGSANLAQAQAYLDGILHSSAPEAEPLKPLAQLLAADNAEAQRLTDQLDKANQQVRDGQRRIDQLNGMLEGLKAIERTLPVRPNAVVPPATK